MVRNLTRRTARNPMSDPSAVPTPGGLVDAETACGAEPVLWGDRRLLVQIVAGGTETSTQRPRRHVPAA